MSLLRLSEKTHEKFIRFFDKTAKMHEGKEFELAYSDIQRETGTASTTLKRALQALEAEGWLQIKSGRNTRYGRFKVLAARESTESVQNAEGVTQAAENSIEISTNPQGEILDLYNQMENLRRRIRTQEMTIALLQERLAEVEDKLYKR